MIPNCVNFLKATSKKNFLHRRFLDRHGFVVVTNVMPEEENNKCIKGMFTHRSQRRHYPASAAGVGIKGGVGGECESCTMSAIGSHMAGPIPLKLSGIDQGNSASALGRVRGRMIQDS